MKDGCHMYKAKISMLVKFRIQIKSALFSFWGRVFLCLAIEKPFFKWYANNVNRELMSKPDVLYITLASLIAVLFLCVGFVFVSREAVDEAICYTGGDGFPLVRVALGTFLPGEVLFFLLTVVPWGDLIFWVFSFLPYNFARFGNYTSAVLNYLYEVSYVVPQGRAQAVFGQTFYELCDLAAFLPIYAVYELACVLAFIVVFAIIYKIKHSRLAEYESKFDLY